MKNLFIRYGAIFCTVFMLALGAASFAKAATFTVSDLGDTGLNTQLRAAITAANASAGPHTINFSVAGTITPLTPLPAIVQSGVTIDGTTAPGYMANSSSTAFNGTLVVELNGSSAGTSGIGLTISSSNCTITGLVINRFEVAGIRIDNGTTTTTNNTIINNLIGTDTTGLIARGNFNRGILIVGSTLNIIGSTGVATRNVISGNSGTGISITGGGSATIRRNLIGTDKTGTVDLGNTQDGIRIVDSSGSFIGVQGNSGGRNIISGNDGSGVSIIQSSALASAANNIIANNYIGVDVNGNATTIIGNFQTSTVGNTGSGVLINAAGNTVGGITTSGSDVARNVISGNRANGVSIGTNFAINNAVSGNFIGVGANGTTSIGNRDNGVQISNLAASNTVGGGTTTVGACDNLCNLIANNGDPANATSARSGIYVDPTGRASNSIRGNSVFNNTGIGIDLAAVGTTANDLADPDTGPNNIQNFPIVSSAETNGNVVGSLNSTPNTTFAIDFYNNLVSDGTASEGRTFIGSTTVVTDGGGNATFSFGSTATLTAGQFVTATATSTSGSAQAIGDTSEFSAARTVLTSTAGAGQGFEADVSPRPNGSGSPMGQNPVTSTDVSQIERFQLGLDTDYMSNEFQRADSAPLSTRGNGVVSSTDVAQATRYQLGLDMPQTAGGPTAGSRPASSATKVRRISETANEDSPAAPRTVRIVNNTANPGSTVQVIVQVDAMGDESVYGFSVNYETSKLTLQSVAAGPATLGGLAQSNSNTPGQIGFSVNFGNNTITAGNNQTMFTITFAVAANAPAGASHLTFGDVPTVREVSNTMAQPLPTTFANGAVTISSAPGTRVVRVVSMDGSRGNTVAVPITVDALGDESVYGFSVNYDTSKLTLQSITNGAGTTGALVGTNTNTPGQIGFSVNFGAGNTITAGNNQTFFTVNFLISATADEGTTSLFFGDAPTVRQVSGTMAQPLAATFANGNVNVLAPTAAGVSVEGGVFASKTSPISGATVILTDGDGNVFRTRTNSFGHFTFVDVSVGQTYTLTVSHRRYTFSSQVLNVNDNVRNLKIFADQ